MREILFRGKNPDYGWVYGCLVVKYDDAFGQPICIIQERRSPARYYVEYATIGQYTGLKDKNGAKIFEGDILRFPAQNDWEKKNYVGYEVFFHDNDSADRHIGWQMNRAHFYGALCGGEDPYSFLPQWTNSMEIIGNIHDKEGEE